MSRSRSVLAALALGAAAAVSLPVLAPADPLPPPAHVDVTAPTSTASRWAGLAYAVADRRAAEELWYATVARQAQDAADAAVRRSRARQRPSSGRSGRSGSKACVADRENGGDYGRSSNPSHAGRYQFSRSTWIAYGGDPGTWENASPAEQDAVFERAWNSPGGPSNWLPYDGC